MNAAASQGGGARTPWGGRGVASGSRVERARDRPSPTSSVVREAASGANHRTRHAHDNDHATDHEPFHVHIFQDSDFIGRWDIENQCEMDDFSASRKLRKALLATGYLLEEKA